MWCIPDNLDAEYIDRMEDVLNIYGKPFDPAEPVVAFDEKPVVLHEEKREPKPAVPGRIKRRDGHYVRNGSANIFCAVEPLTGRFKVLATKQRGATDYAKFLHRLERMYPDARTIHLVQDNLNIHCLNSLVKFYGSEEGQRIWSRFTVHFTPKHGSWLNQAEIALSVYGRQCLEKRRVASLDELRAITNDWSNRTRGRGLPIHWKFSTKEARKKFKYRRTGSRVLFTRQRQ